MFELAISVFCAYQNAKLARKKGQNTVLWVFITIVSFFVAYTIAAVALVLMMYKGPMDKDALQQFIASHPFLYITVLFIGLGGYLLIRYILERMPDKSSR